MATGSSYHLVHLAMLLRQNFLIPVDVLTQIEDVKSHWVYYVVKSIRVIHFLFCLIGTRWQYAVLPLNPQKANSYRQSGLGSVGWVETGGVVYNHLSNPDGSLAAYYELDSLDVCGGHSSPNSQYHYHLVRNLRIFDEKDIFN